MRRTVAIFGVQPSVSLAAATVATGLILCREKRRRMAGKSTSTEAGAEYYALSRCPKHHPPYPGCTASAPGQCARRLSLSVTDDPTFPESQINGHRRRIALCAGNAAADPACRGRKRSTSNAERAMEHPVCAAPVATMSSSLLADG
ncbi:hypothetical protein MRX96_029659 [Rhipicephalus microplus]